MSFEKRLQGIINGQYDILATGTVVTTQLKDSLLFTDSTIKQTGFSTTKERRRKKTAYTSRVSLIWHISIFM